ncbi:MAG: cytochrome c [Balneolaceae bacterium]|nr:MAG: cytochrome c [Balneolaceae bacterium]
MHFKTLLNYTLPALIFIAACGSDDTDKLTEFQINHGIGPVTQVIELGEIDLEKAEQGRQIFNTYCVACHQLDAVVTAPRLRNVANRREPEFILNYILNPIEMSNRHPVGRELSTSYPGVKAELGISESQAYLLLEYLRAANANEL